MELTNYARENEAASPAYAAPSAAAAIALYNLAAAVRKMKDAHNELLSQVNASERCVRYGDRGPSVHGGIVAAASAFESAVVLRDAYADNAAEYFSTTGYHYRAALAGSRSVGLTYVEEYIKPKFETAEEVEK